MFRQGDESTYDVYELQDNRVDHKEVECRGVKLESFHLVRTVVEEFTQKSFHRRSSCLPSGNDVIHFPDLRAPIV
jgi:hypothetical protein